MNSFKIVFEGLNGTNRPPFGFSAEAVIDSVQWPKYQGVVGV